ncbi:MAG: hypothetical protein BRD47_00860, partial [Bacteroidetes bacterium QS_8_68_28]
MHFPVPFRKMMASENASDAEDEEHPAEAVDEIAGRLEDLEDGRDDAEDDASEEETGEVAGSGESENESSENSSPEETPAGEYEEEASGGSAEKSAEKAGGRRMPQPDIEGPADPDVLLDAPEVSVDEI